MNLYYKGNLLYPNARAYARGLGINLVAGLNEVPDERGRELLKVYPDAFDAESAVKAAANKKAIAESERKAAEGEKKPAEGAVKSDAGPEKKKPKE